jgi:uncharacterized membrane protein YgcG
MRNLMKVIGICGLLALSAPSFAQVSFDIHLGPPPPRHEVIVASPYPDGVWIAGYHRWDYATGADIWVPGRWDHPPHPGWVWHGARYPRRGGRYGFVDGHWGARGGHGGGGRDGGGRGSGRR